MQWLIIIFFLSFGSWAGPAAAQTQTKQEERRVEEEKRHELRPTEAEYYQVPAIAVVEEELPPADYLEKLAEKRTADQADGAYVMAVLLGEDGQLRDFSSRKRFLIDNGLLSKRTAEKFSPKIPLRRGLLAYMMYKALGMKGGLTLRVFGPTQRYAHKELVYKRIMLSGSSGEYVSGEELVHTFVKAADYIDRTKNK